MFANDMRKGTVVMLRGGSRATIMDNAKGMIRQALVEGLVTEIGSIYVHDIAHIVVSGGQGTLVTEPVELTPRQAKQSKRIKAFGF